MGADGLPPAHGAAKLHLAAQGIPAYLEGLAVVGGACVGSSLARLPLTCGWCGVGYCPFCPVGVEFYPKQGYGKTPLHPGSLVRVALWGTSAGDCSGRYPFVSCSVMGGFAAHGPAHDSRGSSLARHRRGGANVPGRNCLRSPPSPGWASPPNTRC